MPKLAVLFDLDGVISDTASVHAKAWKTVFDEVLELNGHRDQPFILPGDYLRHVDGKTRLAGIESFLEARRIRLPMGCDDDVGIATVNGIGNAKNALFRDILDRDGVHLFQDALRLIKQLTALGVELGLASSSKNARLILDKAGLMGSFKAVMDGIEAERSGVASKPDPAFYRYAAGLLGRRPQECVVIEDAISGVVSARQAGVATVVGVARGNEGATLAANGADPVVESLDQLRVEIFGVAEASLELVR